jgi:hypothetical protein
MPEYANFGIASGRHPWPLGRIAQDSLGTQGLIKLSQDYQLPMNDARSEGSEFLTSAVHFAQCRLFSLSMKTL